MVWLNFKNRNRFFFTFKLDIPNYYCNLIGHSPKNNRRQDGKNPSEKLTSSFFYKKKIAHKKFPLWNWSLVLWKWKFKGPSTFCERVHNFAKKPRFFVAKNSQWKFYITFCDKHQHYDIVFNSDVSAPTPSECASIHLWRSNYAKL